MPGTKPSKNSIGKIIFFAICLLMQIAWLLVIILRLNEKYSIISAVTAVLTTIVVIRIYGSPKNSAFKISWFFLIVTVPVVGLLVYTLSGYSFGIKHINHRFEQAFKMRHGAMPDDNAALAQLKEENLKIYRQCSYISALGTYPIYKGGALRYFPSALEGLEAQKAALQNAKSYIFMEYFAIEDSRAFGELKEILTQKASEGVEVRMLFDDAGSISYVNGSFVREMRNLGIECRVFNPIMPLLNFFMNHRDHRKITVVDGIVGFTGGYNLADEYFNYVSPHGHWKDTGVEIHGAAVQNLTAMFLEMWDAMSAGESDYGKYLLPCPECPDEPGYIQPYADSPLDDERVGENVYLNMIKGAENYVHIVTPYLILDDETASELILAAKRGVEVHIITPGIPDKRLVYQITRSYYGQLTRGGVHISEYTPGFPHAKMVICDGETAVVGTINLDYRSLYLHFEDAVFMYGCAAIADIETDFQSTRSVSHDVSEDYSKQPVHLRLWESILRLLAPLL